MRLDLITDMLPIKDRFTADEGRQAAELNLRQKISEAAAAEFLAAYRAIQDLSREDLLKVCSMAMAGILINDDLIDKWRTAYESAMEGRSKMRDAVRDATEKIGSYVAKRDGGS